MKILKTAKIIIFSLFIILTLSFAIYLIPFEKISARIPIVNSLYNNTSLTISSKNGIADVKINDKDYGKTPIEIKDLVPGEYTITMNRVNNKESFYQERKLSIDLSNDTEAIIDIEIGPNDVTHGYYLYYKPAPKIDTKGYLTINSHIGEVDVFLDDDFLNKSPINTQILTAKEYKLRITKIGYENLEIPIIIREGYNLNCNIYLMRKPINIDVINE